MIYGMKPFNGAEMRSYLDILNETDDGTKVTVDPATGNKTVSGSEGTTTYDAKGQKIAYQTPSINGTSQTTNYQTGEKITTGQVGGISTSITQRPDQSTVKTASTNLGDVTAATTQGIGFGGAGKNVQQGGNQVSSITNAQGQTTSFLGQPQQQDVEKAMQEDEELPGTKGEWRHGGHSVKYDPSSRTVHVKGRGGEHKHTFSKDPKHDVYRSRVQQIIDKLENDLTEAEQLRTFITLVS